MKKLLLIFLLGLSTIVGAQDKIRTGEILFTKTPLPADTLATTSAGRLRYDPITGKYRFWNSLTNNWFSYQLPFSVSNGIYKNGVDVRLGAPFIQSSTILGELDQFGLLFDKDGDWYAPNTFLAFSGDWENAGTYTSLALDGTFANMTSRFSSSRNSFIESQSDATRAQNYLYTNYDGNKLQFTMRSGTTTANHYAIITSTGSTPFEGLTYGADYSANYTDRSLVDKEYVDNAVSGGGGITGSGTNNELTYWTSSTSLGALTTTTYPSLTELSRVKGVTSSIQTQLNGKIPLTGAATLGNLVLANDNNNFIISGQDNSINISSSNSISTFGSQFNIGKNPYSTTSTEGYELFSSANIGDYVVGFKGVQNSAKLGAFNITTPDTDQLYIEATTTSGNVNNLTVVDNRSSKKGLQYAATGYVNDSLSLTTKEYVDGVDNTKWSLSSGGNLTGNNIISGAFNVDFTNTNTRFNSGNLQIWNPARTFKYTINTANWTADRTISIPTITAPGSMMINAAPTITRIPYYIDANWLTTSSLFTFNGTTFTTPNITSNGVGSFFNGTSSGEIRIYEPSGSGTNYNSFSTAAQTANINYTLPTTAPSINGQVLSSTTAGVMSWATPSGGVGGSTGTVDNAILRADGTGGSTLQASPITIDDLGATQIGNSSINTTASITVASSETNEALTINSKGTSGITLNSWLQVTSTTASNPRALTTAGALSMFSGGSLNIEGSLTKIGGASTVNSGGTNYQTEITASNISGTATTAGSVFIYGGSSSNANPAGNVVITSGNNSSTGMDGNIIIDSNGGSVEIVGTGEGITATVTDKPMSIIQNTVDVPVLEIKTNDSPQIPQYSIYQNSTQTSNNTLTTIHSISGLGASGSFDENTTIIGYVIGVRTGGSAGTVGDVASYEIKQVYKNVGTTVTLVGGTVTAIGESNSSWDCQVNISGSDLLIQVQGATDNNINWIMSKLEVMTARSF